MSGEVSEEVSVDSAADEARCLVPKNEIAENCTAATVPTVAIGIHCEDQEIKSLRLNLRCRRLGVNLHDL